MQQRGCRGPGADRVPRVCAPAPSGAGGARSPGSTPPPARSRPPRVLLTGGPAMQAVASAAGSQGMGGLRAPPGRGHRAERGPARRHDGDGVRHRRRHLLAARGRRPALGHVEPRRGTRAGPFDRLAVPATHAAPAPPAGAGHAQALGIKKAWAATIEYTPDHLPLTGPLVLRDGTRGGRRRRSRARAATA